MDTDRLNALARLLVEYSLQLRGGDLFRLRGEAVAMPLLNAVYRAAIERGAQPFVVVTEPQWEAARLRYAPESALDFVSSLEQQTIEALNADLIVVAESDPYSLANVPPGRLSRYERAQAGLQARWAERTGLESDWLRWCAVLYPTPAAAQQAHLSYPLFAEQVSQAMFLNTPDPATAWRTLSNKQQRLCDWLAERDTIRVVADGTDITFRVAGRHWFNADGRLNLPDGEIVTSPLEDSANGVVSFSFPTLWRGHDIVGTKFWLENGQVVQHEAALGRDILTEMLRLDHGASRLGEFAFGNNPQLTGVFRHPLLDEKIGGTCHFALGSSIPGTGGTNRSALHWDFVCDLRSRGRVFADGQLIHENGHFVGPLADRPTRKLFWQRT